MSNPGDQPIRVQLIDGNADFREDLARAIDAEPGMSVVGQANDLGIGLREVAALQPSLILVDHGPRADILELMASCSVLAPNAKLLAMCYYVNIAHVANALRVGSRGYLLKTSKLHFIEAIRHVESGGLFFSRAVAEVAWRSMRQDMSRSEVTLLRLLAGGASIAQIARLASTTPSAVDEASKCLFMKLGERREEAKPPNPRPKPPRAAAILVPKDPPDSPLPPFADALELE